MSESKHTPGPWKSFQRLSQDGLPEIVVTAENGCPIAVVSNHAEFKANTRLIAAAPELLEALKVCAALINIQNGNLHQDVNAILDVTKAAVAKAEGRS